MKYMYCNIIPLCHLTTPVSQMGTPTITLESKPVGPSSQVTKKLVSSGDSDTIIPSTSHPSY